MFTALKKYFVCFITAASLTLPLSAVVAESAEYQYNQATVEQDWEFTGGTLTAEADGFKTEDYGIDATAIYKDKVWADDYTYTLMLNGWAGGDVNQIHIYFNYQDENNYYYAAIPAGSGNVIKLYRVVDGKGKDDKNPGTPLAEYASTAGDESDINWKDKVFCLRYNQGNIVLTASAPDGTPKELFNINDSSSPTYGKVGFRMRWTAGTVKNIHVSGTLYNETEEADYLSVTSQSIDNGAVNLDATGKLNVEFNADLRQNTINKENITMPGVDESLYTVSGDGNRVTVSWQGLEYGQKYDIVFGDGLVRDDSGNSFKTGSYTVSFQTRASKDLLDYVYDTKLLKNDWNLINGNEFASVDNGLEVANYSANASALLNAYEWRNSYVFSTVMQNYASGGTNQVVMYFNYRSSSDYYAVAVGGGDTETQVQLYKMEAGEKKPIAAYENYHIFWTPTKFEINYNNGNIVVTAERDGQKTTLFDITGEVSSGGKVGVGTITCAGKFENMTVSGVGSDLHLRMVESSIENMAQKVPTDVSLSFVFSDNLKNVSKTNVLVYEDGEVMPEAKYTLTQGAQRNALQIDFAEELKQKTEYTISFEPAFSSSATGVGLNFADANFKFTTVPPIFYMEKKAQCESKDFTSVSECAGKNVDFQVKLENNKEAALPYQLTIAVVSGSGKTLSLKYYNGNIPQNGNIQHEDTIFVPEETDADAKLMYFIWDGLDSMKILYPSGAF